jgi:uncharacterized membrane protein
MGNFMVEWFLGAIIIAVLYLSITYVEQNGIPSFISTLAVLVGVLLTMVLVALLIIFGPILAFNILKTAMNLPLAIWILIT